MITFRHHVVSLVAVFLALGIGVLAGTSFFSQATVAALQASQRRLAQRNEELRTQLESTQKANSQLLEFAAASRDSLVAGALQDQPVVLLSFETTPEAAVDAVGQTMIRAGARLEGSVELSTNLDLATESRRQQVALALEVPTADADELRVRLVERLAVALSGRDGGILQRLADAGLARRQDSAAGGTKPLASLAEPGSMIVVLAPVPDRRSRSPLAEEVVVPLLRSLAALSVLVGVGEARTDALELVALVRQDPALHVVTVDGVDGPIGQAALVLGLRAAAAGRFGHYGLGEGAVAPVPETSAQGP